MLWLGVAYLGALAALFITSLWTVDGFTGVIQREWTLENFRDLFTTEVYRTITIRTLLTAVAVTLIDAVIAFPIALFMAKVASPRLQRILVIAVLTPLWASYLVKAYAWRGMLSESGPVAWIAAAVRARLARLRTGRHGDHAVLPLAALHDPADVRRARAAAQLAARGVGRPRRLDGDDDAPDRAAGALPGGGGRVDLRVLPHARRLHRGEDRGRAPTRCSATSSTTTS